MRTSLTIAGIEVELTAERRLEAIITRAYAPFLGAVADPACRLHLVVDDYLAGADPEAGIDGPAAGRHVRLSHPLFRAGIDETAHGMIFTPTKASAVDTALMTIFALLAPSHDALLVRGSGVISGKHAHVFVGGSDSGPSQLAALAGHRPLLADGYVLMRPQDHGWAAAGTPFGGCNLKASRQAPLAGLWQPRIWPVIESTPMEQRDALRLLVEHTELPSPDAATGKAAYDLAGALTSAVPVKELAFDESELVWDEIEAVAIPSGR
jgi:hypothetical protein